MKRKSAFVAAIVCILMSATLCQAADLGVTADQFRMGFNNAMNSVGLGGRYGMGRMNIAKGTTFKTFTGHANGISIRGAVDKNTDKITETTVMITGGSVTVKDAVLIFAGCMAVLHPTITVGDCVRTITGLFYYAIDNGQGSEIVGNIKYSVSVRSGRNFWLTIKPIR